MVASNLHLDNCGDNVNTTRKMCSFLNVRYVNRFNGIFKGQVKKDQLLLGLPITEPVNIGKGVDLINVKARIKCTPMKGDKVSMSGDVDFKRTNEQFPG